MKAQAQKDYDELQDRVRKFRIDELVKHDVLTLAEHIADLEAERYELIDRIENLQMDLDNAEAELQEAKLDGLDSLVSDLARAIAVDDELTRRADLTGGEIDQALRDDIHSMTWDVLLTVSAITNVDVSETYELVRV